MSMIQDPSPVVSTMPSRITTISNCSFMRERWDKSKKGLLGLISWQMVRGDTRKSWSAPVPKPTSSSHWSRGRNSPSGVWRDWKTVKREGSGQRQREEPGKWNEDRKETGKRRLDASYRKAGEERLLFQHRLSSFRLMKQDINLQSSNKIFYLTKITNGTWHNVRTLHYKSSIQNVT